VYSVNLSFPTAKQHESGEQAEKLKLFILLQDGLSRKILLGGAVWKGKKIPLQFVKLANNKFLPNISQTKEGGKGKKKREEI